MGEPETDAGDRGPIECRAGTYALRLRCAESEGIHVGALGRMKTREGDYVYVGSAFGPGGVDARVRRHRRRDKSCHWHVDHLRAVAELRETWVSYDPVRRECAWARIIADADGSAVPLRGFGASDCRCPAHLFRVPLDLGWPWFRRAVRIEIPGHDPIHRHPEAAAGCGDTSRRSGTTRGRPSSGSDS